MKERGIPFTAQMVRAVLNGWKLQTRRVVHPDIVSDISGDGENVLRRCPYGEEGDRLWVREAYRVTRTLNQLPPRDLKPRQMTVCFEAGGSISNNRGRDGVLRWQEEPDFPGDRMPEWIGKLRPGMFMCRWMSRITLEITGVRIERRQDISYEDILAEGIRIGVFDLEKAEAMPMETKRRLATDAYFALVESIYGPGSWAANPWVWVVEFKRVDA